MKNLLLGRVDYQQDGVFEGTEAFVVDCAENTVWIARVQHLRAVDSDSKIIREFDWGNERGDAAVIDLQFFYDSAEICACLADGSALLVNTESGHVIKTELAPSFSAASWSPDLSILAACDGFAITFFDRFFELVSMCELNTTERGKDEQVTVGWGSKETQFQGSAGKAAREKPLESNRAAYDDDSGRNHIKWRADGQLLLISHRTEDTSERHIMIFNKEGELLSRFKNDRPFEECFAVKPVGNYIATTTRNNDGCRNLIFFERNGEKRHEYSHPSTHDDRIVEVSWDLSGTVLMFLYRGETADRVELWTVSNYDWNIKWSHLFRDRIISAKWDSEKAMTLSLVTAGSAFIRLSFGQSYSRIGTTMCVVSSDGFRVTDLARAPIPPPMFQYFLPCTKKLAFAHDDDRLVVVHEDWSLSIYHQENTLQLLKSVPVTPEEEWKIVSSAHLLQNDLVLVINGEKVVKINLETAEWSQLETLPVKSVVAVFASESSLHNITGGGTCYQLEDHWEELYNLPDSTFYDVKCSNGHILVLSPSHELFLDGRPMATAVRSFILHDDVCVYVTLQNQIFFVSVSDGFKSLDKVRSVELGSELVSCIPEKMALVQQMPRGNLETIYPRIFVVQAVRRLIHSTEYVEALRIMKKHRINMNILVDYDFESFKTNCDRLFGEDSAADLVDLFLANLCNELSEFCEGKAEGNKVEKVAKLVEEAILRLDQPALLNFFTVLLSALLKHSSPEVEKSLQYIKQHTDQMNPQDRDHYSRHWLHHVGFFVPEKEMFNAALATYDLHLTVQVAEASNRDPKEYLPLLNELRKVQPEEYRRYRIQVVREDWGAALKELAELPEKIEEAVALVKNRNLHSHALSIFKGKEHFNKIAAVVALHLETKGQWAEAALLYEKVGNQEKTLECLELSRNVAALKEAALRFQVGDDVMVQKFRKMAIHLESDGRLDEAYKALCLARASPSQICLLLSKASQWLDAMEYLQKEPAARSHIQVSAKGRVDLLLTEIATRGENIVKYAKRLEVVRSVKEKRMQNLKEGLESGRDLEDIDAFSEAGSTISMLSRKTGKTGTSRASTTATMRKRKQIEKKKQSLKEGGEYEDSALLLVLHEQYKWIETTSLEVKKLLLCLIQLDFYEEASHLQSALVKLCQLAKGRLPHIWPTRLEPKHLCGPLQLIYTVDDTFFFPEDGGMPKSIVVEPEMVPPALTDPSSWQLTCFL